MGTVGLSFGSPTSGVGFDVSSTVSAIVANLQNVETPWKTQLASLESQDTAISSLGTLFSNLSNDMSSLTNLEGILSEKTGSSSDTNVLSLTAADSSAIAGTHTVTVTNLATTSSGYMAEISNAADKLSGSVTLQAGSGAAQTITISSDNTLSGLAAAINSSGVGITASVLTDASGSRLSLVSGSSGADGNISISGNSIVAASAQLSYSGVAGSTGVASTGALTGITDAGDTLSGSISIQVGSGTAHTVTISSDNTLSALAGSISAAGIGVTASVVTNSDGSSSLSLLSSTTGTAGTLTVASSILDTSDSLGYTSTVTGENANLTVDGISLTSASNTVANLIPGVTFQLLAPSTEESNSTLEPVQVVIGNDNTNVESTVNRFVTDYNSLVSAMNTQDGNTSSGTPEALFGSPTLSLLQQQLLGGLNTTNPNGSLASISDTAGTTLSGSISIKVGSGTSETVTLSSSNNSLSGLAAAINAAASGTTMSYSGTAGSTGVASNGTLTAAGAGTGTILSGTMSIEVGSGTTESVVFGAQPSSGAATNTIYTGSGVNTLSGLAAAITAANIGVTAATVTTDGTTSLALTSGTTGTAGTLTVTSSVFAAGTGVTATVVTSGGMSTLALASETAGAEGALSVSSSIVASTDPALSYSDTGGYTSTTADYGTLTGIANAGDTLSGSVSIQMGSGVTHTINVPPNAVSSPSNTLAGLAGAINTANIGVTATVVTSNGLSSLRLVSGTVGSAGALTVTSNILDTGNVSHTTLNYTNSSDVTSLTGLGISVNNDGSITFDATSLDSVLNSDYSGVVGFFQNTNGWGQNFSTMLTNAGSSAATGILSLASTSNSNIESTLNADITKENSLISAQQTSLTAELNSANEIMEQLPTQLDGVNELYSAITGYNQNQGG